MVIGANILTECSRCGSVQPTTVKITDYGEKKDLCIGCLTEIVLIRLLGDRFEVNGTLSLKRGEKHDNNTRPRSQRQDNSG